MNKKIKIKISETAFEKILFMLNNQVEYSYLRIAYKDGCCKSPKVDIFLDNLRDNDFTENIEGLSIAYDIEVLEKIKEMTLVYRNSSFMIKTIINDNHIKNCSTCNSTCNKNCGK